MATRAAAAAAAAATAAPPTPKHVAGSPATPRRRPKDQAGSPLFAELVWAHYRYERERDRKPDSDADLLTLEQAYLDKLDHFQRTAGKLEHVYWSTTEASAVAMTVKERPERSRKWLARLGPNLLEHDEEIELHRLSDWVLTDTPKVADLMHECDLLAIRVGEVLRGTSERIAMRSLLGVQAHLLGFIERKDPTDGDGKREPNGSKAQANGKGRAKAHAEETTFVKAQHDQLAAIERYYHRAASRAGRLVYISGMLMGLAPVILLGVLLAVSVWASGQLSREDGLLLLCAGAGAVGALVSVISRMGKPEEGKFNIDFELGRPLIRRLGLFRPFLGAIAGLALYGFLTSGIAQVTVTGDEEIAYYGFAAFLAGFSERFVNVIFGTAERRLSPESS